MRQTFVYTALHGSELVGGLPSGKAATYFSLSVVGTPLTFMLAGWQYALIPPIIVFVLYRFNRYKYAAEPCLDAIMVDYELQADSYNPWGARSEPERFYKRSNGFGRFL
jgi:hypothetical protein